MSIWFGRMVNLADLNALTPGTLLEQLGIEFIEIGDDYLKARMPVNHRTCQPAGLLHGGASLALAETLGSVAASLCVDPAQSSCLGLEVNANHIRAVSEGFVTGTASPLHLGRSTQVWEIRIHDERQKLVSVSRLTIAVIARYRDRTRIEGG